MKTCFYIKPLLYHPLSMCKSVCLWPLISRHCLFKGGGAVVDSLFIVAPIVFVGSVFSPCFVFHYLVSFLVLLSS